MKKEIKHRAFNVLGNIAVINFNKGILLKDKKKVANKILKEHANIQTVVEKSGNFHGRLRKMTTRHLAGEKNKEVLYKENGCSFRFNIDDTYFSPRLSNERLEVAKLIKKGEEVLVMFAGVAPFSICIAKNSKAAMVYSNEINQKANKYAELNLQLNKVRREVELVSGDIKKVADKLKQKFDVIVMPRPNLRDTFLKQAFKLSKKGTRIFYYGFCKVDEKGKILEQIYKESKLARKKIKVLKVKNAGEIAPYKVRLRVDFKIL
jgi:tRNA (guanine37-N1)-methyltransferase